MSDTKSPNVESKSAPKSASYATETSPQERARTAESGEQPNAGQLAGRNPAESGDPAVHQVLAERQTAQMNGDEAGMQRADQRLKELGF